MNYYYFQASFNSQHRLDFSLSQNSLVLGSIASNILEQIGTTGGRRGVEHSAPSTAEIYNATALNLRHCSSHGRHIGINDDIIKQ
jgi:hypothetical protein